MHEHLTSISHTCNHLFNECANHNIKSSISEFSLVISFTFVVMPSLSMETTSSTPRAFNLYCFAHHTTLIVLMPQCFASYINCLPNTKPILVYETYSPSGTLRSINILYIVHGLTTNWIITSFDIESSNDHINSYLRQTYCCHDPSLF